MKTWYSIKAAAGAPSAEISLHDEIGAWGIPARDFMRDLKAAGKPQQINLSINSPGGDVFDGLAMYNAIRGTGAQINVRIEGIAASMASVIAMAGHNITIPENAYLMIHNPWGLAIGDADELRDQAEVMDKLKNSMLNIYEKRTGIDREKLAAMMDEETWMDGKECVDLGFADSTENKVALSASAFDTRRFLKMPPSLRNQADEPAPSAPVASEPEKQEPSPTANVEPAAEPAPSAPVAEPEAPAAPEQPKGWIERFVGATRSVDAIKAELATARDAVASVTAERDTLKAEVESLRVRAAKVDEIEAALAVMEKEAASAAAKAVEIVAAAGFTPEQEKQLPPVTSTSSNAVEAEEDKALARFNELKGEERTAFFNANSEKIKRAQFRNRK